ncbi:MAG: GAF domain-containing protein [Blastocatellia bacterium]|nr:GAF domain-containing protein [Blastocatellia bacterium]
MDNSGQKRGTLDADPPSADAPDDLYRDLVERANDIFVIVGGDGVIQFVNQTYSRLTGIARREIEGEKLAALFAPDERQNAQSRLTWALQSGGQSAVSLPLRTRGGEAVEISFRPSAERSPEGALARMILVGQSPFLYGDLAEQFNSLHRDLKGYSTQLERMNLELEQRIQERTARLSALFEISASLNAELHLDALFEQILRQAIETIPGAEAGALLLYDAEVDRLLVQAATGYENQNLIHDLQIEMERIQPQAVFADRKVRIWGGEARAKSGQMRLLLRHVDQFRIRSAISAPIATPTERLGVLLLHNFDEPKAFTEDDVSLAASLASSAAIAITNARLYDETRQQAERLELVNRLSGFGARLGGSRPDARPRGRGPAPRAFRKPGRDHALRRDGGARELLRPVQRAWREVADGPAVAAARHASAPRGSRLPRVTYRRGRPRGSADRGRAASHRRARRRVARGRSAGRPRPVHRDGRAAPVRPRAPLEGLGSQPRRICCPAGRDCRPSGATARQAARDGARVAGALPRGEHPHRHVGPRGAARPDPHGHR